MEFGKSEQPKWTGNALGELTANCKLDEFFRISEVLRRIERLEKLAGIRR